MISNAMTKRACTSPHEILHRTFSFFSWSVIYTISFTIGNNPEANTGRFNKGNLFRDMSVAKV